MLTKQPININFSNGLNTKTDPWQLSIGQFLSLQNSIFTTGGRLTKRNGFGALTSLPAGANVNYSTTFGNDLTAIGSSLFAYATGSKTWIDKGVFQPINLSVFPIARSAVNIIQCDSVTATNNFTCSVFTENQNGTITYWYQIQDSGTAQAIQNATQIPVTSGAISGSPRVFLLGGYFVIAFANTISGTAHLQYIAVSVSNPTTIVQTSTDLASDIIYSSTVNWDGIVVGDNLFFAYNTTSGGQKIEINYLTAGLNLGTATSYSSSIATIMSICADSNYIYAAFWDAAGSTGYAFAVDQSLNKRMSATEWLSSGTIDNVTCTASGGVLQIVYENANTYSYDSTIASNYLSQNTVTLPSTVTTGTVGTAENVIRSVGLASKAFLMNGTTYFLTAYDGKSASSAAFQPTYFLVNLSGSIVAKLAYENGGGYLTLGLPQAQMIGSSVYVGYLYKDLVTAINKAQGAASAAGVYSQAGADLAIFSFSSQTLSTAEIGNNLNLSGGYLYAYDGSNITEQNFHLWPDSIECSWNASSAVTPTGSWSSGATSITVSSASGISPGMTIADTSNSSYIPSGTTVISVSGTTVVISAATTHSASGDSLSIQGNIAAKPDGSTNTNAYYYQVIYQWTDAQGNIFNSAPSIPVGVTTTGSGTAGTITITGPYLRLTSKTNCKIVIYRWSVGQQEYYQTTSITNPILNVTTSDSWSFVDTLPDSEIIGNGLIYTTGGVLEDVGGPACTALTLFDTRLWAIDAEDQNLLWYSKQVIEGTPVEMSDLLTFYVAPNAGTTTSTGPMKCLAPMDDKLIIFKKNAIYYINGTGPDNTGSNSSYSQPIFITSTIGSINQNSIVFIPQGLMFQSDKGIWLLGRDLSTSYIGAGVEEFNSFTVTSAVAIPGTTQIRFTLNDNKTTLMFDYFYNQWGTFINTNAVSSCIYQNLHTLVSSYGGVFQETSGVYLDNGTPVLMSFTTSWLNLAGLQGYQRAWAMFLLGEYYSPHKLNIGVAYNYNPSIQQTTLITPTNFSSSVASPYGDMPAPFGQTGAFYVGDNEGAVMSWRIFFARQRCSSIQITLNEIYDPTYGVQAGQGLTLSGMNLVVMLKKGWRTTSAQHTAGGGTNTG